MTAHDTVPERYRAVTDRPYIRRISLRRISLLGAFVLAGSLIACSKSSNKSETSGRALFGMHCAPCHDTPPPDLLKEPPKLNGLFTAKTLPSGAPATDEQVRKVIVEGLRTMPAFDRRLTEQDVRDIIAYLHTLK